MRVRTVVFGIVVTLAVLGCAGSRSGAAPSSGNVLTLGRAAVVERKASYTVDGTKLALTVVESAMAMASDRAGHDFEYLHMTLQVTLDGTKETLSVSETAPVTWHGFTFKVDSNGFAWSGPGAGSLTVSR